jgi:hypothetical protein
MINKYAIGGTAPSGDKKAAIQKAIMSISKVTGEQPETIIAALQNGGESFQQVIQAIEQGDVQSAKQLIKKLAGTPMARYGAKLNYIRSLKGECPEGQEVKYFKQGGQMKCKCVDKAAGGEKVKDGKKEIADFKKKKACGGLKAKFADGGKPKADNKKWTEKDDKKLLKYRLKGTKNPAEKRDSTEVQTKWNRLPEKEKAKYEVKEKCGGKVKKHQHGGSLNGIPFISPVPLRMV